MYSTGIYTREHVASAHSQNSNESGGNKYSMLEYVQVHSL